MMINKKIYILLFLACILVLFHSCGVRKGYDALKIYNYFEAKKQFEKALKNNTSPAAYGLSVIYFRKDNPFHNIDSAYHYSLLSVESFNKAEERKHQKWKENIDYSLAKAKHHRELISDQGYFKAIEENTVEGFQDFLARYPWSNVIPDARDKRDSLAFLIAKAVDTSSIYETYLEKYPKSRWANKIQNLLYHAQYKESVVPNQPKSYLRFIHEYPGNPLVRDAQYQIYVIETADNSIQAYDEFIKSFPNNSFVNDAWKKLYRLSIADYKKASIEKFAKNHPLFPFPELIKGDLKLVGQTLYQFAENGKFGFMGTDGNVIIAPKFQYVQSFHNGLAVAIENNKYGYINKDGRKIIDFQYDEAFDFDRGRAIVQQNGKYGLIDVIGNYILEPRYIDLGSFSEGLMYVQDSSGYQFFTMDGSLAFSSVFDEAFSFKNGMARVKKGEKIGYIGKDGSFIASVKKGDIHPFHDSLFVHELRDSVNLIHSDGTSLFQKGFDRIGVLSDDRAIVEREGKYGYINGKGEVVIPLKYIPYSNYIQLSEFTNHHALLKKGEKFALINDKGKQVLPAIFYGIGVYGQLIPARKSGAWGYVNEDVRLKIKYQFDYAHEFIDSLAIVEKDMRYGLINLEGEEVLPIAFQSIKRNNLGMFVIEQDNLFGILSNKGKELVKPKFEKVDIVDKNLYQLIKNNTIEYYDVSKDKIIKLKEQNGQNN